MKKLAPSQPMVCSQPALGAFALLVLIALLSILYGCQSRWAAPHPKGVKGQYNFLDTFDGKHLESKKWEFTIQHFWPPGTSNRLDNLSKLVPQPYDFKLDGNTYVELVDGKLVQFVNCSNWYDTIRTWPIWEAPTEDTSKVYFFIWGAAITRVMCLTIPGTQVTSVSSSHCAMSTNRAISTTGNSTWPSKGFSRAA
jgi:hypothetical protein